MRSQQFCFVLLSMLVAPFAGADPIELLLGEWVSPDGVSKQQYERQFDGNWITTRMWFKGEQGWTQVAAGALYRKPGTDKWQSVSRTSNMQGISLFESEVLPLGEGKYEISNRSYMDDGTMMVTEELWNVGASSFDYTIFQLQDGKRTPWYKGGWVRP